MKTHIQLLGFAVAIICGGAEAFAQLPAHYYPVKPPMSPYFAYSAFNTTGLPNYYTYVRPALQEQQYMRMAEQASRAAMVSSRIVLSEQAVGEIVQRTLMERQTTGYGAPAVAATFQDLSNFYPRAAPARVIRR
jgi:hypothetical protein